MILCFPAFLMLAMSWYLYIKKLSSQQWNELLCFCIKITISLRRSHEVVLVFLQKSKAEREKGPDELLVPWWLWQSCVWPEFQSPSLVFFCCANKTPPDPRLNGCQGYGCKPLILVNSAWNYAFINASLHRLKPYLIIFQHKWAFPLLKKLQASQINCWLLFPELSSL